MQRGESVKYQWENTESFEFRTLPHQQISKGAALHDGLATLKHRGLPTHLTMSSVVMMCFHIFLQQLHFHCPQALMMKFQKLEVTDFSLLSCQCNWPEKMASGILSLPQARTDAEPNRTLRERRPWMARCSAKRALPPRCRRDRGEIAGHIFLTPVREVVVFLMVSTVIMEY